MSQGQSVNPQPVVVVPSTGFERWKIFITPITLVLLFIAANKGWLTPAQVEIIRPLVAAKAPEETTETVTTTTTSKPSPVTAVAAESVVAAAKPKPRVIESVATQHVVSASPEIQEWIDRLMPFIIDWLKPKPPGPLPPVPPNPTPPVPPNPVPPTPQPGTLKVVLHDKTKTPITSATVEAGRWFRVSATGATGAIQWDVVSATTPEIGESAFNERGVGQEYTGSLAAGEWVNFTVWNGASKASIRVSCNHGPRPGPNPEPVPPQPDPEPEPEPQPNTDRILGLIVFSDKETRTPDTTKLLMSRYWQELSERHRVAVYVRSTNEKVGKAFAAEIGNMTGDVLLIRDDAKSAKLEAIPLPKSEADFASAIRAWSSR